jgi:FtsP/CotA-like multicopper oxidase with cupredoxin domain
VMTLSRRTLFKTIPAGAICAYAAPLSWATDATDRVELEAEPQTVRWFGDTTTEIWGYNSTAIKLQQYVPVTIAFTNRLTEPTTVHWHGMRVDNAMDGVSGLTQAPVQPGESFDYRITPSDAGTFWAHAHHQTYRQLALGLYTPIIVAEAQPYPVDRDLLFVADDWLLTSQDQLDTASLEDTHAWAHAGRMGNVLTVNRLRLPELAVQAGDRVRLRVMNTANSRIMRFGFPGLTPYIIAKDGQPLSQPMAHKGVLTLAPAERYDLVLDIPQDWAGLYPINERSGKQPFLAAQWQVTAAAGSRSLEAVVALPANPLPKAEFKTQQKLTLAMQGGAMGNLTTALYQGKRLSVQELIANKQVWTLNGVANMPQAPLLTAKVGEGIEIALHNTTQWPHAMHLHGQHFRAFNEVTQQELWQDTLLVQAGDTQTIRFLAMTPGKWLLHCHMIEHQVSGMVTFVEVRA